MQTYASDPVSVTFPIDRSNCVISCHHSILILATCPLALARVVHTHSAAAAEEIQERDGLQPNSALQRMSQKYPVRANQTELGSTYRRPSFDVCCVKGESERLNHGPTELSQLQTSCQWMQGGALLDSEGLPSLLNAGLFPSTCFSLSGKNTVTPTPTR